MLELRDRQALQLALKNVCNVLNGCGDSLEEFDALHPEIQFLSKMLILVQGMGMSLQEKVGDILSELSEIPDSFSDILEDVNLTVSSKDGVVTVNLISCIPESQGQVISFADTNFVVALLKAYNHVKAHKLTRPNYFQTRVTSFASGVNATHIIQLVPFPDLYLEFDNGIGSPTEYAIDELEVGTKTNLFEVVEKTDEIIKICWAMPFVGKLSLLGSKDDETDDNSGLE